MIDPKELRMGNWLQCDIWDNGNVSELTVYYVTPDELYLAEPDGCVCNGNFSFGGVDPIKLTPEILNKFGWEYSDSGYATEGYWDEEEGFFAIGPGYDYETEKEDGYVFTANGNEYVSSNPIYYLHQLQNLYFAITGKELIYNPNASKND